MHIFTKVVFLVLSLYSVFVAISFSRFTDFKETAIKAKVDDFKEFFAKIQDGEPSNDFLSFNDLDEQSKVEKEVQDITETTPTPKTKASQDTREATNIMRGLNPFYILGAYPKINSTYQSSFRYNTPFAGIYPDEDYCEKVDFYNLNNSDLLFNEINFYSDFPSHHLPRKDIMEKLGKMAMETYRMRDVKGIRKYHLDHTINFFHVDAGHFHYYLKLGTNFACATQMYSHIPGINALVRKDEVVNRAHAYAQKYQNQPQCFNESYLFPYTYRLYNEEECQAFFNKINSQVYQDGVSDGTIEYVVKVGYGVHKSQGVFLLDKDETLKINEEFDYGMNCGEINKSLIAQTYVNNPLLLDLNNKFDFRIYMLIASTNPLIVYYHDGFLRVSLSEYKKSSSDRATHLTNTYLANQVIQDAKENNQSINGMTEDELNEYILWSFERFEQYLLDSGKIMDPNWLNNYLRPSFHKAMVHLVRMTKDALWKQSNVYALHGVDFMLDDEMNLWFIESNPSPLLTGTTKWKVYYDVLMSMFEIEFAYYRSRMMRVMDVIKRMQEEVLENGVVDYNKWSLEYQEASRNRLEPQYQISENNTFTLIMDENLSGAEAYFGSLPSECV